MEQMSTNTNANNTISRFLKKSRDKKPSILIEFVEPDPIHVYKILREPHKNNDFIPPQLIFQIVKHHFNSAELLHSFSQNHLLFKIQIKDILNAAINNWEYNRPPDMARCRDIARYIYNSRKPTDTTIYLTYKNILDRFEVLDGIHRLTALQLIHSENSKVLTISNDSESNYSESNNNEVDNADNEFGLNEFGSNNDACWLYNQYLLINIRFNSGLGDLIEIFKTLNKSQTVPDIYIRDVAKEKRDIINTIANDWQIRFSKHFSSSANPIMGHTNRNKFVDLLDKIYDKYKIDETKVKKFKKILNDANTDISQKIPSKISIDIRAKCRETGCYLFLYKNNKLEEFI
jgi:hypothetical protein